MLKTLELKKTAVRRRRFKLPEPPDWYALLNTLIVVLYLVFIIRDILDIYHVIDITKTYFIDRANDFILVFTVFFAIGLVQFRPSVRNKRRTFFWALMCNSVFQLAIFFLLIFFNFLDNWR